MRSIVLFFIMRVTVAAQSDSIYIKKIVDDMTDQVIYAASSPLTLSNNEKTIGINLDPFLDEGPRFSEILCTMVGLGACNERSDLIVMFEDSSKVTIRSWNKYNCKGIAYFAIGSHDKFATKRVLKIRVTNGLSGESYTNVLPKSKQEYFIKLLAACNSKKYVTVKRD